MDFWSDLSYVLLNGALFWGLMKARFAKVFLFIGLWALFHVFLGFFSFHYPEFFEAWSFPGFLPK